MDCRRAGGLPSRHCEASLIGEAGAIEDGVVRVVQESNCTVSGGRGLRLLITLGVLGVIGASQCTAQTCGRSGWLTGGSRGRPSSEPFGAEDKGAEDNQPSIPEPMVFDLVRGLGAHRGEFEVNVLAEFPFGGSGGAAPAGFDPFGLAPASADQDGIEWAPEVELAVADGLALEFELPYENSTLEAYKFATQLTFGTALDNRFIHGTQTIIEPDVHFDNWDLTFLYLAGMQFDRTWSVMGMLGVRPEFEQGEGLEHVDGLFNLTIFADVCDSTTLGLETNFSFGERDRTSFLLMPQIDHEITDHIEIQAGVGAGFSTEGTEPLAAVRAIYSR